MPQLDLKIGDPAPPAAPNIPMIPSATGGMQTDPNNPPTPPVPGANKPEPDGTQKPDARPEWLPEKFKTPEDLAKAYAELEKSKSQPTPPAVPPTPPAPVDLTTVAKEFKDGGGKLSDATYEKLEKQGIPKAAVDAFIAGQQALGQQTLASLTETVGGAETLTSVLQWADGGADAEVVKAYNAAIDANNVGLAKTLLQSIHQQYVAANGRDPKLVTGASQPRVSGDLPFESTAQIVEAMRNPKYQTDEAFRKQVERRLAVTNL